MAITKLKGRSLGDQISGASEVRGTIVGPASYSTGGFTADIVADLGVAIADIDFVQVTSDAGYTGVFDGANKILAYDGATQVSAAVSLATVNFDVCVKVKSTAS